MAKQTAVEWYSQKHLKLLYQLNKKELSIAAYVVLHNEVLNQAKTKEKEQIENAFGQGTIDVETQEFNNQADRYYNETFKGGDNGGAN